MFSSFHDWTEKKYRVIPVRGKVPALPWTEFRDRLPTETETKCWQDNLDKGLFTGIGLILGEASGLIAVDYDCMNSYPEIEKLIPKSIVMRVGREPKWLCFYKWSEAFRSKRKINLPNGDCIEVLTDGQFAVVEGMHPITGKDYFYPNVHLLESKKLPEFPEYVWASLEQASEKLMTAVPEKERLVHENGGRHHELVRIAGEAIYNDKDDAEIIDKLIEADKLFSESYFNTHNNTPEKMVASVRKTHERKIEKERKAMVIDIPKAAPLAKDKPKLPAITGMMKTFVDYLNKASVSENTQIYLGASLAWLSMCVASRWKVETKAFSTPCNLYIWCVMPSGVGKDSPQALIHRLFYGHRVLGASNYKSAPALLMALNNEVTKKTGGKTELSFKAQRENLLVIDECSSLFRMMASGENYQQDMVELFNTLFSRSGGYFAGDQCIKRGANYGASYNPYFSGLGFTTFNHFKEIAGHRIVGNGFFERSLVFIKTKKSKYNDNQVRDEDMFIEMKKFTDDLMSLPIELVDYGQVVPPEKEITTEVNYRPFPIVPEAENFLNHYRKKMYEIESDDIDESFFNRFTELATKLALLHAVSDKKKLVELSDVEWASQLVEWCYFHAKPVFETMKEQDIYKQAVTKINTWLMRQPEKKALRRDVQRCVRIERDGWKRAALLEEIIKMGMLDISVSEDKKQWISYQEK